MIRTGITLTLIACCLSMTNAQPEEFKTIDGIVKALYSSISGPAGERDWDYFRSLYKPNAIMGAISPNPDGALEYHSLTPEDYIAKNGPFFLKNGFWEKEIGREVQRFGEVAHVYTAYEFEMKGKDEVVKRRGINSVQLVFDSDRWWIVSIQWDSERDGNTIPASMLNK
jgi:hypothetical protein